MHMSSLILQFEVCFLDSDERIKLFVTKKSEEDPVPASVLLRNLAVKLAGTISADNVNAGYFWGEQKEYSGEMNVQQFSTLTFCPGKTKRTKGREMLLQRNSGQGTRGKVRPSSPRFDLGNQTEALTSPRSPKTFPRNEDSEIQERLNQRRFQSVLRVKKERASAAKRPGLESVLRDKDKCK